MIRVLLISFILFVAFYTILWLAGRTEYFDKERIKLWLSVVMYGIIAIVCTGIAVSTIAVMDKLF
jgi:hypothetical protein